MATFRSGNGSYVEVGAVRLDIATGTINTGARLVENTHSGTAGASNYEKVVDDASWTIEVPWDEANQPDTDAGLLPGSKVTLKQFHGAGAKFITLTNTTVESFETVLNNSTDIIRCRIAGKGGSITRTVT